MAATVVGSAGFYVGSTALALNSEPYRDFFLDVPGGKEILAECEKLGWDNLALSKKGQTVVEQARKEGAVAAAHSAQARLQAQLAQSKAAAQARAAEAKSKVKDVADSVVTKVEKVTPAAAASAVKKTAAAVASAVKPDGKSDKPVPKGDADGVAELIKLVEDALKGVTDAGHSAAAGVVHSAEKTVEKSTGPVYTKPLPLGFEPPPGYSVPKKTAPPSTPAAPAPEPSLSDLKSSDPQVAKLVASIEALARVAKDDPSAAAALSSAHASLKALSVKLDGVPAKIENEIAARDKEHTRAVLELEMAAQNRFDEQEDMWRSAFELERRKILEAYREKLQSELDAHSALIEERYVHHS